MSIKITGYPSIDRPWLKYYNDPEKFEVPKCKNFDYVYSRAKEYGDNTALEYFSAKISFNEMFDKVEIVSRALKALNVKEKEIVSVCLPNIPEVVYVYYAINRIGAVANMLDVRCNSSTLIESCIDANSKLLITLDMVLDKFLEGKDRTSLRNIVSVPPTNSIGGVFKLTSAIKNKLRSSDSSVMSWKAFIKHADDYTGTIDSDYIPDSPAVIAYTGGTTGIPKGVIATNENLNSVVETEKYCEFQTQIGDRCLLMAPPWTFYGLNNCINAYLCMGQSMIMIPKFDADELGQLIIKHRPNHVITVPSSMFAVLKDVKEDFDLSFLKTVIVGADKLDETLEERINQFFKAHNCNIHITKGYGMTEVTAAASYSKDNCNQIGGVGIPYVGNTISAFEIDSEPPIELKVGELGEIAITGPSVMVGYFGAAASETPSVLKKHSDGRIWAHTGDIGHIDENGILHIDGRIKRMFTKHGFKVFAAEVERQIMQHEGVESCAVVGVPDEIYGNLEKAYVVLKNGANKEEVRNELIEMLNASLYDYEVPDDIEFINEMPLTGMNKIDFKALENIH